MVEAELWPFGGEGEGHGYGSVELTGAIPVVGLLRLRTETTTLTCYPLQAPARPPS
jgi:hypothetical protein